MRSATRGSHSRTSRIAGIAAAVLLAGMASAPLRGAAADAAPGPDAGPPPRLAIHTVVPGESLWAIATRIGTTPERLQGLNQLPDPDWLVPGLSLLVPEAGPAAKEAAGWTSSPRPVVTANAYLVPSGSEEQDRDRAAAAAPFLTSLTVWGTTIRPDGSLAPSPGGAAVAAARSAGAAPVLSVVNFRDGNFDGELAHRVLNHPAARRRLVAAIVDRARQEGYRGIDIDFEDLYPGDRDLFTRFLAELVPAAHARGLPVSVAMAPKASDRPHEAWVGFFDYAAIGALVDQVRLMTYEWGWVGGPPMAIAPLHQVRAVLEYATGTIPPEKILMGIPLYGYDWELPDTPENLARPVSAQRAIAIATSRGSEIRWDRRSASPWFRYRDDRGVLHEVWFEDARSIGAKYALAKEFGVGGLTYWVLGNEFPQNWTLLRQAFRVSR